MPYLPFIVYERHAGVEFVEREAIFDTDPVHSCKLNVQLNSSSRTEGSHGETVNGLAGWYQPDVNARTMEWDIKYEPSGREISARIV